jgi:hypothetical protein
VYVAGGSAIGPSAVDLRRVGDETPAAELSTGDSARIAGSAGERLTAGPQGAEVLVWELPPW